MITRRTLERVSHTILPVALALGLSACTPAQIGTGVIVGRAVVHYTCAGARKVCDWSGNLEHPACRFLASACDAIGEGAGGESAPAPLEPAPAPSVP